MKFKIVFLMLIILSMPVLALDKLTGFVNDEDNVISAEYEQLLNDELYNLKLNTSVEMAVATVKSLNGTPIEEYSLNLAHKTLGEQGKDNGILILLAVDDREYRIETGYGIEPIINAALAGRIGRNTMEPRFKEGNYEQGIADGVKVISAILRNDTSLETEGTGEWGSEDFKASTATIVIFVIILIIMAAGIMSAYKKAKEEAKKKAKKEGKEDDKDFLAALILANMFGRGGSGGSGGIGGFGGGSGGFGGFGGGSFGGGGISGKF